MEAIGRFAEIGSKSYSKIERGARMRRSCLLISSCAAAGFWIGGAVAAMPSDFSTLVQQMGLKAGQWHTTIRVVAADISPLDPKGVVPPDAQTALRSRVGSSFETDDCIGTTGLTANGDLILPGVKISAGCSLNGTEGDRRRLTLRAACDDATGEFKAEVNGQATHGDTTMAAEIETSASSRKLGYATKLTISTTSNYVGECSLR